MALFGIPRAKPYCSPEAGILAARSNGPLWHPKNSNKSEFGAARAALIAASCCFCASVLSPWKIHLAHPSPSPSLILDASTAGEQPRFFNLAPDSLPLTGLPFHVGLVHFVFSSHSPPPTLATPASSAEQLQSRSPRSHRLPCADQFDAVHRRLQALTSSGLDFCTKSLGLAVPP